MTRPILRCRTLTPDQLRVPSARMDEKVGEFVDAFVHGATQALKLSKTIINVPLRTLAHALVDTRR